MQQEIQLELFALYPERMRRIVLENGEIELHQTAVGPVAELKFRRYQSLIDQALGRTERRQHIQRGRMKGGGAQVFRQGVLGLEHCHGNAGLGQAGRRAQTHRAGAGYQNPIMHVATAPSNRRPP